MIKRTAFKAFVCLFLTSGLLIGQTPVPPAQQDPADVVRVNTELVQTDVMVFNKNGQFVRDLKKEDFELKIDGNPKAVEFFETIVAGTANEELKLAAARGAASSTTEGSRITPLDRGRSVFFYVDDVHLDLQSLAASRKLIKHFIDTEMGQNDQAAVASTTGQIGFLQQLTDNKVVLNKAVERLSYKAFNNRSMEEPRMTEYQALLIDRYERDITSYFVGETIKRNPGMTMETALSIVTSRARIMVQMGSSATTNTFVGLDGLVKSLKDQPGRKLVFFISGGFFLDHRNSINVDRMNRITSNAARSGVVIYSMDARGLIASLQDSSESGQFDMTGALHRAESGEIFATQDGMNALAKNTGGKAFFNTNALEPGLKRALDETSTYYLLAWKPEGQTTNKFRRLEVKVIGRPELTVQVRRGFFDIEPEEPARTAKKTEGDEKPPASGAEAQLRKVINQAYPNREIPISLNLNYLDDPQRGTLLSASMQIPGEFLSPANIDGKHQVTVNLAGTFYNERGQVGATFNKPVTLEVPEANKAALEKGLVYRYNLFLKPGLYQVRVGARDEKSGRAGSAHRWIDIPDLSTGAFALSSLFVGGRDGNSESKPTPIDMSLAAAHQSVVQLFSRNDYLRFLVFAYNPTLSPTDSKPDLAVQVQLIRDEQPVVTAPLRQISIQGLTDLKRVPYAAEISLADLPAGQYQLHVSIVDRVSKRSASQQIRFDIR
ncbi:MAG TPA: VWA domain-containing protein [Pyrinomonadaceae bacterium]|nr:VWA domain-containing protein [Pyrinomonadaceae bacterium]